MVESKSGLGALRVERYCCLFRLVVWWGGCFGINKMRFYTNTIDCADQRVREVIGMTKNEQTPQREFRSRMNEKRDECDQF